MDLCLEETAFICRAAVYKTRSGSCSLTRFLSFFEPREADFYIIFVPGLQKHEALRIRALSAVEMGVTTWKTTVSMVSITVTLS